ncbi:LOW QUALITY PROTEIN: hypothetical protein CFOL_v3_18872, partial [Cephalotus follicularis]
KPYSRRIDVLRMPLGYQPPKFQQFDGTMSQKQHVAHFIETCNKVGTFGDSMVKQFVRSIKELANTKQQKDELVVDYIERWRNLVLNRNERISGVSSIDMCVQGMHWGLLYSIKSNMSISFEELATRAHDLELQIARHEIKKQNSKPKIEYKATTSQPKKNGKRTLKELEEKEYPFSNSVLDILDQLLREKLIELPTLKRPEDVEVNDPKYYRNHRIVSHPSEKCFILKDVILQLINEMKIALEVNENITTSNVVMVSFGSFDP